MQSWWISLVIAISIIPLLFLSLKSGKSNYEAFKFANQFQRYSDYLKKVLTSRDAYEERTVFQFGDELNKKWETEVLKAININIKQQLANFVKVRASSIVTIFIAVLISATFLIPLQSGSLTIGMFMSLITATFNFVYIVLWELTEVTKQIAHSKEFLFDIVSFFKLPNIVGKVSIQKVPWHTNDISVEFINVSFSYPGTDIKILNNVSFKLDKVKHYAFVGANGAGKSTIIKLMLGLFDNYSGTILLNGVNIKNIDNEILNNFFSVVFQDFTRFELSIGENLKLGNSKQTTNEELISQLENVDMLEIVKSLPKGLETKLGKLYTNSIDISGGQWQRIAIARVLLKDNAIYVLDEPTAALDPIAENSIYELFRKASNKKLTLFVTHRLGTIKLADEILVLNDGQIVEKGSHKELMKQKGQYYKMYESQRGWYL